MYQAHEMMKKEKKIPSEETEWKSKPESDMAGMLELSEWEFKTTTINMLGF